jgi:hypothetical protein
MPQFGLVGSDGLIVAQRSDDWKRAGGVSVPSGTSTLLMTPQGVVLAVAPRGLFRLVGDPSVERKTLNAFGFELPLSPTAARFVPASDDLSLHSPFVAAVDAQSGDVAVYDRKQVTILKSDVGGRYKPWLIQERESDEAVTLALSCGKLLFAWADGRVEIFSGAEFSQWREFQPEGQNTPRFVTASPDGRYFAVVFHHHRLWVYDTQRGEPLQAGIAGQGDISAAAFSEHTLLVADRFTRVSQYELDPPRLARRYAPDRSWFEKIYFYIVKPVYTVFPKPSELDNVANYLLTGSQSIALTNDRSDLGMERLHLDIWGPIWSNLAFVAVVVALGCWYTKRKDF